jgi:hypothetical protein
LAGKYTLLTPSTGLQIDPQFSGSAGASSGMSASTAMGYGGLAMGMIGAISGGIGSYFQAESMKSSLSFQSQMSDINAESAKFNAALNARGAEKTAQSIMSAGQQAIGQVGLKAGKVKGSELASQGARGIAIGEGNTAERIATIDLMKEIDSLTINANMVRQAMATREAGASTYGAEMARATGYQNESLIKGTTADSISPFSSMSTSLMSGATSVASNWYRFKRGGE